MQMKASANLGNARPARPRRRRVGSVRAGFSLTEALVAISIIVLLVALVLVALAQGRRTAAAGASAQLMAGISVGMTSFKQQFGFAPPLVEGQRDLADINKPQDRVAFEPNPDKPGENRIRVYIPSDPKDATFLRGETLTINENNPLATQDDRFSLDALGIYLCGVLEMPRKVGGNDKDLPIDGVPGAGLAKPQLDGTFTSGKYETFVDVSRKSLQLVRVDGGNYPTAELRDRGGTPLRYYRWLKDKNPTKWEDLNIPPMVVGPKYREYLSTTPAAQRSQPDARLNDAVWAIVMAGENKVFGDEPIETLKEKLNSDKDEAALRAEAWADNIVEVGSDR
jgi:type II secretory pathway pseudopilin PulG